MAASDKPTSLASIWSTEKITDGVPFLTTQVCDIHKRTFVALARPASIFTTPSARILVDVGGFCVECNQFLCHEHVEFKPDPREPTGSDPDAEFRRKSYELGWPPHVLCCRKDGARCSWGLTSPKASGPSSRRYG
jgi:hypothetical protein